jgi:hypothetical protein
MAKTKSSATKQGITKPIGAAGTAVYGGYVQSNEKNAKLIGTSKYETYSEMLANITIIASGVRYYLNLIAKSKWSVVPADETPESQEYADIITEQIDSMGTSWTRVVKRAAMYRFYGFSIQAWYAYKKDGIILFKDMDPRPQSTITRWDVDEFGYVHGVYQTSPLTQEEIYLPRDRLIYIVDDSLNDSPEGLGLFRHIVEATNRLKRYEQLEGFGFETDLRGIPVGKAPISTLNQQVEDGLISELDRANALQPLKDFLKKHIVNPALGYFMDSTPYISTSERGQISSTPQWGLELLKGGSTSLGEMAKAIERLNREIARALSVEGMLLGETGTQALSKDKSLNLAIVVDSALEEIADTLDHDFIKRIGELNGWDMELLPKFKTEAIRNRDISQLTQSIKDLSDIGVVITEEDALVNEIIEQLGLSPLVERMKADLSLDDNDSDMEEKAKDVKEVKEKPKAVKDEIEEEDE